MLSTTRLSAVAALAIIYSTLRVSAVAPFDLGVSPNSLKYGNVSIGFLPGWGEAKSPNTASSLSALLSRPMSSVGCYVPIVKQDPSFTYIDGYVNAILQQPGRPVLQLALMPYEGLSSVTQDVANRIADKMADINYRQNVTVWLRYGHEMNGDWYPWGVMPEQFVASWRMVASAVHAKTNRTYMNWSPNARFADSLSDTRGGYTQYWPGKQYVDMVGLSYYHYGGYERLNQVPSPGEALGVLSEFDRLYGSAQVLPMILSETSASYTTILQTGQPAEGGGSQYDIKMTWLKQLLSCDMLRNVTSLSSICLFEIIKDENAAGNSIVKEEDFRLIDSTDTKLNRDAIALLSQGNSSTALCL